MIMAQNFFTDLKLGGKKGTGSTGKKLEENRTGDNSLRF
jgi:hypothetical protein